MKNQKMHITTQKAPQPFGTYSQAVKCENLLFVSGQLPIATNDTKIISDDPIAQIRQCFENLKAICEEAGASLNDAVKINVYYTEIVVSDKLNDVMNEFFEAPYPARIRVKVAGLSKEAKVEIDGVFACTN